MGGRVLSVGATIWVPCEVKPGPFSDERLIKVASLHGEWVGFVNTTYLKDPATTAGHTYVRAVVTGVRDDIFQARVPGHALTTKLFEGTTAGVVQADAVKS